MTGPTRGGGADVLVVEDDATLALSLEIVLELAGHAPRVVGTLGDARAAVVARTPDAIVLDLGLPDGDGLSLLDALRGRGDTTPVLVLTARGTVDARVEGLMRGADDYLPKPFDTDELVARLTALLRRGRWGQRQGRPSRTLTAGLLVVDLDARTATRQGEPTSLTSKELELLEYLVTRPGRAVSRAELLAEVWGVAADVKTRTVDQFISRLRKLVEQDASRPQWLQSVRGVGYRWAPAGDDPPGEG